VTDRSSRTGAADRGPLQATATALARTLSGQGRHAEAIALLQDVLAVQVSLQAGPPPRL
jgi:hypothetical protein